MKRKLLDRLTVPEVTTALRNRSSMAAFLSDVAKARIVKALDAAGKRMTESTMTIASLRPAAFDEVLPWVAANKGHVPYATDDGALAIFGEGVAYISSGSSAGAVRVRFRGGSRARTTLKGPRRIDVCLDLFGSEEWVSFMRGCRPHFEKWKVRAPTRKVDKKLHVLTIGQKAIRLKAIAAFEDPLQRDNYSEEVLTMFDRAVGVLSAKDPDGRLLIVNGPPGVGKTFMIQALIHALTGPRCVLVPSQYVQHFTEPMFGSFLMRQKKATCLIVEDADMLLVGRGADNMQAISSMLNLADGMFGAVSDVRIVCTTNAKRLEIEPALLRSGRLIDQIKVGHLSSERASAVYRRLTGNDHTFDKSTVSLADVYAKARQAPETAQ